MASNDNAKIPLLFAVHDDGSISRPTWEEAFGHHFGHHFDSGNDSKKSKEGCDGPRPQSRSIDNEHYQQQQHRDDPQSSTDMDIEDDLDREMMMSGGSGSVNSNPKAQAKGLTCQRTLDETLTFQRKKKSKLQPTSKAKAKAETAFDFKKALTFGQWWNLGIQHSAGHLG